MSKPTIQRGSGKSPAEGVASELDRPIPVPGPHKIRPHVILGIDRFGWAFHSDSSGLIKHLSNDFSFAWPHGSRAPEADLFLAFRWRLLPKLDTSRVGAVICGLFDTWSWPLVGFNELQAAFDRSAVVLVGNQYILNDLRNHPAALRPPACFVCEEGVDCEIFEPQPLPSEFAVGWAGTTANAKSNDRHDGKGVQLIRKAADMAGAKFICARRIDYRGRRTTYSQIPHGQMPAEFYRRISTYCVGSYSEGAPLTVAEALACGRPVVATNVGNVPRLVQNGVNGFLVDRTPESISAAIKEIKVIGPEKLSAWARRAALQFDWSRMAPLWKACFFAALSVGQRRTHARIPQRPEYASGEWSVTHKDILL